MTSGTAEVPAFRWDGFRLASLATLMALVGGVATVSSTGGNPQACGGNIGCLLSSGNLAGLLHEGVALVLLICTLITVGLAWRDRARLPERVFPALLALALVVATAGWGASLAVGAIPDALAPGVLVLLVGAALALLWGIWVRPTGTQNLSGPAPLDPV